MTLCLDQAAIADATQAGGKAASLARLAAVASIPPFFVVAPEDGALTPQDRADLVSRARALGGSVFAVRSSASEAGPPQYEIRARSHAVAVSSFGDPRQIVGSRIQHSRLCHAGGAATARLAKQHHL